MVCLRNISVDTLHKGDTEDDDAVQMVVDYAVQMVVDYVAQMVVDYAAQMVVQ
jgi:hypothetical protein